MLYNHSPLLISEPPLQVLPSLAQKIGLNEAIIVQQVHYWLNPKFNKNYFEGRHWVWNTYEQWQQQFPFWGMNTIRRAISNLEESGILISFVTRDFKKLKYYSIDYDLLNSLLTVDVDNNGKIAENLVTCPSAQNGQIDLLKSTDRTAQNGQIDQTNMGSSYNKDTENTNSENTLLLHTSQKQQIDKTDLSKKEDEKDLKIKTMLAIWNETVQKNINPEVTVSLTKKRQEAMQICLIDVFGQDLSSWQAYCDSIAQNGFLNGDNSSGFKVSLDWAIKIDNAYKILEGAIYAKPSKNPIKIGHSTKEEILNQISSRVSEKLWLEIIDKLIDRLSLPTFQSWLINADFSFEEQGRAVIWVDNLFFRDSIESKFLRDIEAAIKTVRPSINSIQIQVK